jgi:hypothetical protein
MLPGATMMAATLFDTTVRPDRAVLRGLQVLCAVLAIAAFASTALGQQNPPASAEAAPLQAQPTDPAAPAVTQKPGLPTPPEVISAIGRLIDRSISNVGAGIKGAGETLGTTTDAANDIARGVGDAASTIARLPTSNVVSGWERCAVAPNGAPDCEVASSALCKAKGFARGRSIDITSSHKCPAQVWLEGRQPSEAECKQESFVSRAICQ